MEIVVGKMAGFCKGVENAVKKAEENVKKGEIYCLGELVHNGQVIEDLESKGMITVNDIDEIPDGKIVIFRAHGEGEKVYEKARGKNLEIVDLTCGYVSKIHEKVKKEKQNSFIIILGKKNHPEVIGTKGFAGENSFVIESEEDILDAYMEYEKTYLGRVYVVAQTTFSSKLFDELAKEIETNFIEADVVIDKTICMATEQRQLETEKMSKVFHTMIIIGGKHSSNTKELANVAKKNCENVYLIQGINDLKEIKFDMSKNIGVMAGASTPKYIIDDVKKYLEM